MAHIVETLRELLENPELRAALADAFYAGIDSPSQFQEISLADHIRHARGIDASGTPFEDLPDKLNEAMQSFVLDRLPQPAPITLEELTSLAALHLAGVDLSRADEDENIAQPYQRFVTCAVLEIEQERLNVDAVYYSLGEGWEPPEPDSALADYIDDEWQGVDRANLPSVAIDLDLWTSPSGFSFMCCIGPRGLYGLYDQVYGKFHGYYSDGALQNVESQFSGLVESIAKTVQLCEPNPRISFLTDGDGQLVFAACLSAFCHQPGTVDATLLDRLRNAIVLLSQADEIALEPVALALSFAAIEALVCENDELGPTKQVKRHVATLLVSDAVSRKKKESLIGKLYTIRSGVLHGSQIDWSHAPEINTVARTIAAGVIRAVSCWRDNQLRAGGETSWKELMDELNAASRKPGMMVGVPDLSGLIPDKLPS